MVLNTNKPSLLFFSMDTRERVNEILLDVEGPHGVGNPSGAYYHSGDSLFIFSTSHYRISLINRTGRVLKSISTIHHGSKDDLPGTLRPYTISKPVLVDSLLYVNIAPDLNVYSPVFFTGKNRMRINLNTDRITYFNTYPEEFQGRVWGVNATNFSTTYDGTDFIYSYAISDSIHIAGEHGKQQAFFAGTSYSDKPILPMSNGSFENDLEYVLGNIQYDGIAFDAYRQVYYRFVKLPLDYKDETGKINNFHSKPLSVIILDDSFRVIGETKLEDHKYVSYMYFVGKEGLYVSNANPLNEKIDEDAMEFTLFKLTRP